MSYLMIRGDARRIPIADGSVHCVVCSPPYFGLRDYGVPGQIGLESTPSEFVAAMVRVFREVRRVLRPDGVCFMNLGDSYAGSTMTGGNNGFNASGGENGFKQARQFSKPTTLAPGVKPKDLMMIPHRVAIALQSDGWWVRSDMVWAKPNPMPESVTDRPTKSHEYVFMLTKSERYFWDADAVREPHEMKPQRRTVRLPRPSDRSGDVGFKQFVREEPGVDGNPAGRNIRSVLTIPTESYPGSHFATYPRRLVEPLIKAATSERGCCPECGAPWAREVERGELTSTRNKRLVPSPTSRGDANRDPGNRTDKQPAWDCYYPTTTIGWRPTCPHDHEPVPATVFDPFIGSGTTVVVANALGRRGIGLDLSAEYLGMARRRISRPHAPVARLARDETLPLFAR